MGNIIRLTPEQMAEVSEANELSRSEVIQRLENKQSFFKARMDAALAKVHELEAMDEKSTLFNAEYHHDLHLLDGTNARHDDLSTPQNEGFTMASLAIKSELVTRAKGIHGDWAILYYDMGRIIKAVSEI